MSNQLLTVRCPDDLIQAIQTQHKLTGLTKTQVVIGMLEQSLPSLLVTQRSKLPSIAAIYFVWCKDRLLYIGKAHNLQNRWSGHHRIVQFINAGEDCRISWFAFDTENLGSLPVVEDSFVELLEPEYNNTATGSDRIQLNIRLDGQPELLEAIRNAASSQGKSVNQWCIDCFKARLEIPLEQRLEGELDKALEDKLNSKLDHALLEIRDSLNSKLDAAIEEKFDYLSGRIVVLVNQVVEQRYRDRDRPSLTQLAEQAARSLRQSLEIMTVSVEPEGLSQRKLADRLGVDQETVARHRVKSDFEQWSSRKDPDNTAWRYDADLKKFFVAPIG